MITLLRNGVNYRITVEGDDHAERVTTTVHGIEVAGAYCSSNSNDWRIYLTTAFARLTGLNQPQKSHVCSRAEAVAWLEMLAWLYTKAVP